MSVVRAAACKKAPPAPVKRSLDKEHHKIQSRIEGSEAERDYYVENAHLLFHYYDSVDKGGAVTSSAQAEQAPVGSHRVTVALKQRSVMEYISLDSPTQAADATTAEKATEKATGQSWHVSASRFAGMTRGELLDEFMTRVCPDYSPEPDRGDQRYVKRSVADGECSYCGCSDMVIVPSEGTVVCNGCDTMEYVTVDSDRPSYKDPPRELSYLCYKRSNHLQEWLSQTQGREYTNIPESVHDAIMVELKRQRFTNLADLDRMTLKKILKKLGLNKYFEHLNYIHSLVTGRPGIRIPTAIEAQFKRMFAQIQVPFIRHAPPNRKNCVSYSYCISRFADLLGYDEIQEYLPRLKSKSKREEQNRLWKEICADLRWEYRPQE